MTNYEDMSLEELQALKGNKEKAKIIAQFEADDAAEIMAKTESHDSEVALNAVEEYKNSMKVEDTIVPITQPVQTSNVEMSKEVSFLKDYCGGELNTYEDMLTEGAFNFTNSDAGCDVDVSTWSPADVYVNAVWHTMYQSANLLKLAVKGLAINKGDGLSVQIRAITRSDKSDITTTSAPCECISCGSTSFSTYTITLAKHGISREICDYDIWDVGDVYRKEYLKDLGQVWAEFFDWQIYNELETATPGYSESIVSTSIACDFAIAGSCCTDATLMAFYNSLDKLITNMRVAYYKPDYIIMHPTIARIFRAMQTPSPIFAKSIEIAKDGSLKSVLGITVVEYNAANTCANCDALGGDVAIIVIDSRRAVGAVFGKKPTMESDRNIDCNSTTYVMWAYFNAAELDLNAIGHVKTVNA